MDNSNQNNNAGQGASEGTGYSNSGKDQVLQSGYSDFASPSQTSEQRLTTPHSHIQSINEDSGDSNPALKETIDAEQGHMTTAEMLMAREDAEEAYQREHAARGHQGTQARPHDLSSDAEAMDSSEYQMDFGAADTGAGAISTSGQVDAMAERDNQQVAYNKALHGQTPHVNTDYVDDDDDNIRGLGMKNIPG